MTTENKALIGILVLTVGIIIVGALVSGRGNSVGTDDSAAVDVSRLVRDDSPFAGPADAAVTVTEFGDFECPACGALHPILKEVKKNNPDVKFVFRQFPLVQIHEFAQKAAEASLAAHSQGQFFAYHDLLFENQPALAEEDLLGYAEQLGLDMDQFRQELEDGVHRDQITQGRSDGTAVGITGTPTLFINNLKYRGPVSVAGLQAALDAAKE